MQTSEKEHAKKNPRLRKLLRFLFYICCALFILIAVFFYTLTLPAVQQRLTRTAETFLQEKLGTRVEIGSMRVKFPTTVSLEGFLMEDQQGDTLARVGNLVVSINMWKLLNKTFALKHVTLNNAGVYLYTKDSISNYDFVFRAFAADSSAKALPDTTASPWKLQLDLVVLQLNQVVFLMQDEDARSTVQTDIGTAKTTIAKADLKNRYFELDDFSVTDSDIRLIQRIKSVDSGKPLPSFGLLVKNGDISRTQIVYSTPQRTLNANLEKVNLDQLQLRTDNDLLIIKSSGIQIKKSTVAYRDPEVMPTPGHFNGGDLHLTQLDAIVPDFFYQNDTIYLRANAAAGVDKSGLVIHSLQTDVQVTPSNITLQKIVAQLNQTSLDGDVVLFKNNKEKFNWMQVSLRRAKGIVGDLNLLLPPQENSVLTSLQDIQYEVSGSIKGWLQNLQMENIRLRAGSSTVANFTGSVQHLMEPASMSINLSLNHFSTIRSDLVRWISVGGMPLDSILALPLPVNVSTSGTIKGTLAGLKLTMQGQAGALQTGPAFSVVLGLPLQFDVAGDLTNVNDPDRLAMDLKIFRLDAPHNFFSIFTTDDIQLPDLLQATGTLRGTFTALQTDLKFQARRNGVASQISFKGLLKNVRTPRQIGFDMSFNGALARQEIQSYVPDSVVTAVIRLPDFVQIDGHARGTATDAWAEAGIELGGWGQIHLEGNLLDSAYQMRIVAHNLAIHRLVVDSALLPLKLASFSTQIQGRGFQFGKTAQIQFDGKFDSLIWDNLVLRDIDFDADVTGKRFTGGFQSPDERFAVRVRAAGDFSTAKPLLDLDIALNCVDLRALGWSYRPSTVCMRIFSQSKGLSVDTLTAQVKIEMIDLQYDSVHIRPGDLTLDIKLDNHKNNINIASDWIESEIKGYFSLLDLSTTIANIAEQYIIVDRTAALPPVGTDSLSVEVRLLRTDVLTTGLIPGLTELAPVHLEGLLVAQRNYFNLNIKAPRIVYRDWDVDSLNVRSFAGDAAALFVMTAPLVRKGEQNFIENAVLNGRFFANVGDVSFKASSDDGRERFLFALQAILSNATKETQITLAPIQIIDFKEWKVNPDNAIRIASGGVKIQNFSLTGNGQSISVEGTTQQLANGKTGLDFAVDIERLNYNNFALFIESVFLELDGWAEAHLTIKGTTDAPQVRGKMQLHETFFTPALTNVRYQLSETPLEFTESGVVLNGLTLRDPYDKILEINGNLSTTDWTNIQTNLTLHADRWQVMNSTRKQNPVYFGELYVSLDGTVRGPISQPDIRLVIKTAKESTFTYVYDEAALILQHEGIVYFLPPPRQYVRPPVYDAPVTTLPYTLSASIEIDSNLTVNSVINPVTGDDFRGKATGRLQFDQLSNGNRTLTGRVELVRGTYNYSYQSVVKRSFDVTTGSSITWTGDVGRPELDLKARYQFKASPYPLVVNKLSVSSDTETALYRKPQTFFLQTTLKGSVSQPDVNFEFIYASAESHEGLGANFGNQQSGMVESALSNVNQDKNLLSRQVFGVLLLRNFIGESVGTTNINTGNNPLQSGLTNFLTGQINALADQYLTFIDVDLATTEGATNAGSSQTEGATNYQLRLQKSFFEDRLSFKLSGGTTVTGNGSEATSALENASVEYALTPKGDLKITVFSERGFELLNASSANLRNSGAGVIFTKEFGGKIRKK